MIYQKKAVANNFKYDFNSSISILKGISLEFRVLVNLNFTALKFQILLN